MVVAEDGSVEVNEGNRKRTQSGRLLDIEISSSPKPSSGDADTVQTLRDRVRILEDELKVTVAELRKVSGELAETNFKLDVQMKKVAEKMSTNQHLETVAAFLREENDRLANEAGELERNNMLLEASLKTKMLSLGALIKSNKNLGMKILQLEQQLSTERQENENLLEQNEFLSQEIDHDKLQLHKLEQQVADLRKRLPDLGGEPELELAENSQQIISIVEPAQDGHVEITVDQPRSPYLHTHFLDMGTRVVRNELHPPEKDTHLPHSSPKPPILSGVVITDSIMELPFEVTPLDPLDPPEIAPILGDDVARSSPDFGPADGMDLEDEMNFPGSHQSMESLVIHHSKHEVGPHHQLVAQQLDLEEKLAMAKLQMSLMQIENDHNRIEAQKCDLSRLVQPLVNSFSAPASPAAPAQF